MKRTPRNDRPGMAVDVELLSERQLRAKKGQRDNLYGWTIFLLLLIGVVFVCWIGSFYVFQHPENARSYKILRKLKKIDPPKRFEPTLAPNGRFYHAKDLVKLYAAKTDTELARINLDLLQAYINNYSLKEMQVPYLMGHFSVLQSRALTKSDLLTSGYVALARSLEDPKLIIEQLYPAEPEATEDLRQMLQPGVEIKLERTYDLSAVLHVERLPDDAWQVTIIPLNYDSYGLGDGREVHLAPPLMPNLAGPLPVLEPHLDDESTSIAITKNGKAAPPTPPKEEVPVLARSGPTPDQSVIRVAKAQPLKGMPLSLTKATPTPATVAIIAQVSPSPTPMVLAAIPLAKPTPAETPVPTPPTTPKPVIISSAAPTPKAAASWQTYRAGQMPRGRLIEVPDLEALAKNGGPKSTMYLQGDFTVKAIDGNRAVMRANSRNLLGLGSAPRVIVEYPPGRSAPGAGSQVSRDSSRPFQITAVRRDAKGQINVFVREVTEP